MVNNDGFGRVFIKKNYNVLVMRNICLVSVDTLQISEVRISTAQITSQPEQSMAMRSFCTKESLWSIKISLSFLGFSGLVEGLGLLN